MKEQLLALIKRHNATVKALKDADLPIPEGKLFKAMTIWDKLANEGYEITVIARNHGIDAKCNMQTGEILT